MRAEQMSRAVYRSFKGIILVNGENRSTMTRTYLNPPAALKGPATSILIDSHGLSGIWTMWAIPAGFFVGCLLHWQVSHLWAKLITSCPLPAQQTSRPSTRHPLLFQHMSHRYCPTRL